MTTRIVLETDSDEIRRGRERLREHFGDTPFEPTRVTAAQQAEHDAFSALSKARKARRTESAVAEPETELRLEHVGGEPVLVDRRIEAADPRAKFETMTLSEAAKRLGLSASNATILLGLGNAFTAIEVEAAAKVGWRP